ncbi:MAG: GlxA family transcriptional regulator [Actinomycetota bacterium]|nr:GlxA family transcriptional regulator [Actinomycetota bacterium]
MASDRVLAVVAYDDFQLLDLAGPVEVFDVAAKLGATPGYRCVVVTPGGLPVRSSSGVEVAADTSLADLAQRRSPLDTLLVVGGLGSRSAAEDHELLNQLTAVAGRARRITSVCTGALVLGAAGLLDGYHATTHWAWCDELAQSRPGVIVEADRIYVQDRDRWTSAGVTAGIDLALALVDDDHGAEIAHGAARWLVVFARRPGGQAQFSAQLRAQPARTPAIAEVQRWLPDHLAEDLSVAALARRAGMSQRSFARAFRSETATTPAAHVMDLRVEAARRLLETTELTVAAIATAVGFNHAETLHRAVARHLATTPDRYRQHFARRAS